MDTIPEHLSAEAVELWEEITSEFEPQAHHLRVVQLACEAWDRAQNARRIIDEHGEVIADRWGQLKPNPATQVEQQARRAFVMLLRELGLDADEVDDVARLRREL